jgi:hypothetical protein
MKDATDKRCFDRRDLIFTASVALILAVLVGVIIYKVHKDRPRAQRNSIVSNLQFIAIGAQTYMMDKSVTQVAIMDIISTNPNDGYISTRNVRPVVDEDYSHIVINHRTSQISVTSSAFGTLIYKM